MPNRRLKALVQNSASNISIKVFRLEIKGRNNPVFLAKHLEWINAKVRPDCILGREYATSKDPTIPIARERKSELNSS